MLFELGLDENSIYKFRLYLSVQLMTKNIHFLSPREHRIAVAIFFFVSGFGFASFASRIPSIQHQIGLSEAALGTVLFAMPLGLICTLPITGHLLGKYSSRYILLLGSVMYNVILCLIGLVHTPLQLAVMLFFFGVARNLMNISVNAQSVGVQGFYKNSIVTTFHGVWSLSGFAGAAVGGWMIGHDVTTTIHFAIVGLICLLAMAIAFKNTVGNDVKKQAETKRVLFHFPEGKLLNLSLIAFGCMACEGIMFDWSGIYFQKVLQVPKHLITTGYVAFMSAAAVARFAGDWVVNKIGTQKVLQLGSCSIIIGLTIAVTFPYLYPATLGFVFVGLGISCIVPLIMALAGKTSSKSAGVAIASISTVSYFGFLLGPPIIGYIAEVANLRWSFSLGIMLGIMMLILLRSFSSDSRVD